MSIRFAAIGLSHNHIFNMVNSLLAANAELVWFWGDEPERIQDFAGRYPQATLARSMAEILEDASIGLIVSAAIPMQRPELGILAMRHKKDFLCAKPGFTTLTQLEQVKAVQQTTQRFYGVYFGERFGNEATVKAGELVQSGAIGRVIQTVGFGPHKLLGHVARPDWTFQRATVGGILNDLASHQIDQFLFFTGSTSAQIASAHVGNMYFSQYPNLEDFGDLHLRSDNAVGYIRVDWLTPQGLPTWGDVRLFIYGTDGYLEVRKNYDLGGSGSSNRLFLVDGQQIQAIDCSQGELPFGKQFVFDLQHRTETAMTQAHCFLTSELALLAQQQAIILNAPSPR